MSRWKLVVAGLGTVLVSAPAPAETPSVQGAQLFPSRVLAAHNRVRARAGVPPLRWDSKLGQDAARYAVQLAMTRSFQHSAASTRAGTGENLWRGTRAAFSVETMVASWSSEQRLFSAGVFPNVSRNGNWHDIGHYTQMIWPATTRVGCALATSAEAEYLVCRYSPAGNVYGTPIAVSARATTALEDDAERYFASRGNR